jgi:hypothetical protein
LQEHEKRYSFNPSVQSVSGACVTKKESTSTSFSVAKYSKLTSSAVVEVDKTDRVVLMRNPSKVCVCVSLSQREQYNEKRFSWNPTMKSVMSVVERDKLASTAFIRNHSKGNISKPIPNCFMLGDTVNIDKPLRCVIVLFQQVIVFSALHTVTGIIVESTTIAGSQWANIAFTLSRLIDVM